MKKCSVCKESKPITEFHKKSTKDGLDYKCKTCASLYRKKRYFENIDTERPLRRERSKKFRETNPFSIKNSKLKCRYGITLIEKQKMLLKQKSKCAICKKDIKGKACVDHNHITDEVRELLCDSCNTGIGTFRENTEIMKKAIEYLKKWSEAS